MDFSPGPASGLRADTARRRNSRPRLCLVDRSGLRESECRPTPADIRPNKCRADRAGLRQPRSPRFNTPRFRSSHPDQRSLPWNPPRSPRRNIGSVSLQQLQVPCANFRPHPISGNLKADAAHTPLPTRFPSWDGRCRLEFDIQGVARRRAPSRVGAH